MDKLKAFGLWCYKNLLLKYWYLRYRTTLMSLARLTLLVLLKEVVAPTLYWICVLVNALWRSNTFYNILEYIKVACVPSTTELLIAVLSVIVLLIVAFYQYHTEKRHTDLFRDVYIPYVDAILEYLNIGFYYEWSYNVALNGNTMIAERQLDDLYDMSVYLRSRVRHKGFERLDELFKSLSEVAYDIYKIFNIYGDFSGKDGKITIERFYKGKGVPYNPKYDSDLQKYNDIVMLISDLVFEQTRILNQILKIIRNVQPDYQVLLGVLHTDDVMEHNTYTISEEDSVVYHGLQNFMTERKNRSFHLADGVVDL